MAGANSPSYPVSVAGRAGRESQTRVRPWLVMAGRGPDEGSSSPGRRPTRLYCSANVPGFAASLQEVIQQPVPHIPQRLLCTSFVRGEPRPPRRGTSYNSAVTVSNLSDSLPLRQ